MNGIRKVNILLCAQPNSFPHFGTLLNFLLAFSYAENVRKIYNVNVEVEVILDLLEEAKGEKIEIGESTYFKALKDTYRKSETKSDYEYYREYCEELLEELSALSDVSFRIRTYSEFQKDKYARRTLIKLYNHYDDIARLVSPGEQKLRTRVSCSKCGLYSTNVKDTIVKVGEKSLLFSSTCPEHGRHEIEFTEYNSTEPNPNVPIRNLMRGVSLIENDRRNETLSIIFEGADWSGIWPI